MEIRKSKGLQLSEKVANAIIKEFKNVDTDYEISIDTFNNCRETGYCFKVLNLNKTGELIIWIYEYRCTDNIIFRYTIDDAWFDKYNKYDDESVIYTYREYKHNEIKEVIKDVISKINLYIGGFQDDK